MGLRENGKKIAVYAAQTLVQLLDTNIINKANGDILQYDSTTQKWKNQPTTFTEASSRANIDSGDSISTIFGKIKKFFTDLKAVAFSGSYSDLSNTPTNVSTFTNDSGYLNNSTLPNSIQNLSIADFSDAGSSDAYCYLCRITVNSTYINGPTEIILCERGRAITSRICIFWKSVNTTDPGLDKFCVILGAHTDIWMVKAATSTWDLYVRKNENWSAISVKNVYLYGGITITWKMQNASLPSGGTQAVDIIADKIDTQTMLYGALHNGKLVIQKNGSDVAEFTANESTINTIPANIICNKTEFATQTFEFNVSVAAGGDSVYYPNITKSGWTPLGIVGVYTGGTILCALRWGVTSNTGARVDIHNYYSSTASGTASITVLYYKNT